MKYLEWIPKIFLENLIKYHRSYVIKINCVYFLYIFAMIQSKITTIAILQLLSPTGVGIMSPCWFNMLYKLNDKDWICCKLQQYEVILHMYMYTNARQKLTIYQWLNILSLESLDKQNGRMAIWLGQMSALKKQSLCQMAKCKEIYIRVEWTQTCYIIFLTFNMK